MVYLTPAQCESYSETGKICSERVIDNIPPTVLGTDVEILVAIPASSKMIFSGDNTPLRKVVLQDAENVGRYLRKNKVSGTYF